ncbi:MAG: TraR/DksA C4-type zinc finger protein [Gemmataceae bacterium]|nr:TraR/DksA C4-type zinc finger protein [Gemmataceae bacterium]
MARKDALLRLHTTLTTRRDELRRRLGYELTDLRASDLTGDAADQAFEAGSDEINSQLAELESRELAQIERALGKLRQGSYGVCEGCQKKIPVARLNALPFSITCVECQREMEANGYSAYHGGRGGNWEAVGNMGSDDQREIRLSDLEMDLSHTR